MKEVHNEHVVATGRMARSTRMESAARMPLRVKSTNALQFDST